MNIDLPENIGIQKVMIVPRLDDIDLLLDELALGKRYVVVSDKQTHAVLGKKIEKALARWAVESVLLEEFPQADQALVDHVRSRISYADVVVAVGSGTINDICKYASFLSQKPYVVFGTAPSMNGYIASNASITRNGYKMSMAAHLPRAAFFDLEILTHAPRRLIQSGVGDVLCRSTAQADWWLSHNLLGTFYDDAIFEPLYPLEETLFSEANGLIRGDKFVMQQLIEMLVLSGIGMTLAKGSYPASQAEHMIAHSFEMVYASEYPPIFHGEMIGITTVTMARLQHDLLQQHHGNALRQLRKMVELDDMRDNKARVQKFFGQNAAVKCWQDYQAKCEHLKGCWDLLEGQWSRLWPEVIKGVEKIHRPEYKLRQLLQGIGAAVSYSDFGINLRDYQNAIAFAKYSRNRLTFLDLM